MYGNPRADDNAKLAKAIDYSSRKLDKINGNPINHNGSTVDA